MAAIAYPTTSVGRPCPSGGDRPQLRVVRPERRSSASRTLAGRRRSTRQRAIFWRRRLAALAAVVFLSLALVGAVAVARVAVGAFGGGPLSSPEAPAVRVSAQPAAATSYVVRPG